MLNEKTFHFSVTEGRSARGWTVLIAANGSSEFMAVFRAERDARKFADIERRKVGLRPVYADI